MISSFLGNWLPVFVIIDGIVVPTFCLAKSVCQCILSRQLSFIGWLTSRPYGRVGLILNLLDSMFDNYLCIILQVKFKFVR